MGFQHLQSGFEAIDRMRASASCEVVTLATPSSGLLMSRMDGFTGCSTAEIESPGENDRWDCWMFPRRERRPSTVICDGRSIRLENGLHDFHFAPAGMAGRWVQPASLGVLLIYVERVASASRDDGFRHDPAPVFGGSDEWLVRLSHVLEAQALQPSFGSDLIFDTALRMMQERTGAVATARLKRGNRLYMAPHRLTRVRDYVQANLHRHLSLAELAEQADMSPFHFIRAFRDSTGETPYRYVCLSRLAQAIALLDDASMPLGEVASRCGFARQSHFSAAFRREMGTTPSDYRALFGRPAVRAPDGEDDADGP
jgi:AraC family transcriptional regulator